MDRSIERWKPETLRARLHGDDAALRALASSCLVQHTETLAELRAARTEFDWRAEAHRLRSVFALFGCEGARAHTQSMEARDDLGGDIARQLLVDHLATLLDDLRHFLAEA